MTTQIKFFLGIGVVLVSLAFGSHAFCNFIVVSSQSKALKVGSEISDSAVVEIGGQEQLRLMDKKSGETRVLTGPYKGTVESYSVPCLAGTQSVAGCAPKERDIPFGATRGLR